MCRISKIEIENYRGIRTLRLEGAARVNVILGGNNSGKSSLLEAVLITMGANHPSLPLQMNVNRNYSGVSKDDFALFFYNSDISNSIHLKALYDDRTNLDVTVSYFEEKINEVKIAEINNEVNTLQPRWKYGLKYVYSDRGASYVSTLTNDGAEEKLVMDSSEKGLKRRRTFFVAPRYNFDDYISHFNRIVTDKEKSAIIEILQAVEPTIVDVTVVGSKVMVDCGLDKLVPINLMGDGTRKLFTIATALHGARGGVLIIDEVDNGLYYKSMKVLWKAIMRTAALLDVQLFMSTHSVDSLNALNDIVTEEMKDLRDDVKIFTLRKDGSGSITCYPFAYEKFNYLLDREEEIR